MKIRTGKFTGNMKHLGKSVGASRKRNLKRIASKAYRVRSKNLCRHCPKECCPKNEITKFKEAKIISSEFE